MNIGVLGAGMVGSAMALDLARTHSVTALDYSSRSLESLQNRNRDIRVIRADLQQYDRYPKLLAEFDLIITAVPGYMGFRTLEAVIASGKNVADISFFPENVLDLDTFARRKGVTVITDIGVAPGMSNLILGRYNEEMEVKSFACYVGGLPLHPKPPFNYKAPFSPVDVLEEYSRPARLKEKGRVVTRPALSEIELIEFDSVGLLEAFNTDGLRTLLFTMDRIPDLKEKTLRYPGHAALIIALQQAGFFSETTLQVGSSPVVPAELTREILLNNWKLEPGEEELTVMRVLVSGKKEGRSHTVEFNLIDRTDTGGGVSSMARSTGYTCTAAANLILSGLFKNKGVFPPERVGKSKECFDYILKYLADRGVNWQKKGY